MQALDWVGEVDRQRRDQLRDAVPERAVVVGRSGGDRDAGLHLQALGS
jgi:hypothetical protein